MRRTLGLLSTAFVLGAALALPAQAQERVVHVFNWFDYIDDKLIEEFTAKTGIRVVYDTFDSNEVLETKLLTGGSGYDVVVPTGAFLSRQIQAGVFQKLQKDKLPNLANMWDMVERATANYDPGNAYSINYMWGTVGIGYNVEKVKQALGIDKVDSWSVVFDPAQISKLSDCGVYFLDSPNDVVPSMLGYLGLDPTSTKPEDLAKAQEALLAVRPYVRKFESGEIINALAGGDICVAISWSGDTYMAANRAKEAGQPFQIVYAVPKEGAQMWYDQMAIPADAPNVEEAHAFLNYIMEPEVIARASNYVYFANGNLASQPLILPEITGDPAIYPDDATLKKLYVVPLYQAETQRLVTRIWTKVKAGS